MSLLCLSRTRTRWWPARREAPARARRRCGPPRRHRGAQVGRAAVFVDLATLLRDHPGQFGGVDHGTRSLPPPPAGCVGANLPTHCALIQEDAGTVLGSGLVQPPHLVRLRGQVEITRALEFHVLPMVLNRGERARGPGRSAVCSSSTRLRPVVGGRAAPAGMSTVPRTLYGWLSPMPDTSERQVRSV